MPSKLCNKYEILKEINSNSKIKTYLTRIEPIVKEIIPKDKDDYYIISERLKQLREQPNIYEVIEEKERLYVVIDSDDKEISSKIEELILSDDLNIKKEGVLQGHGNPITKEEILNLFNMENSMCKISFETNNNQKGKGSGFFCKLEGFPIKYALFTNNHVLDESNIEIGKNINFQYLEFKKKLLKPSYNIKEKKILITEDRRVITNKQLDYTFIELFESDGIIDYFKIDPKIFNNDITNFEDNDIFILQFPKGNDLSFSYGKILSLHNNSIIHSASTEKGSSGSPIIRRCKDNYIIGLHFGEYKQKKGLQFNIATIFNSILDDIRDQLNEIVCTYIPSTHNKEIKLLHDYGYGLNLYDEKEYEEASKLNKNLFEEYIDIYIDQKKVKFSFNYRFKEPKEIKVKFIFKKKLTNTSYMFYLCSQLKSIDLTSFNTSQVNNMSYMFYWCSSLKSIDLTSFNTEKVKNMSHMFKSCSSLISIDFSSFKTNNVIDMSSMFFGCRKLIMLLIWLICSVAVILYYQLIYLHLKLII